MKSHPHFQRISSWVPSGFESNRAKNPCSASPSPRGQHRSPAAIKSCSQLAQTRYTKWLGRALGNPDGWDMNRTSGWSFRQERRSSVSRDLAMPAMLSLPFLLTTTQHQEELAHLRRGGPAQPFTRCHNQHFATPSSSPLFRAGRTEACQEGEGRELFKMRVMYQPRPGAATKTPAR